MCALHRFGLFLLPVGIAELAVATELESGNNSYTSEMLF